MNNTKSTNYYELDLGSDETSIRKWENKLGCLRQSFSGIVSKLIVDNDLLLPSSVDEIISKEYSKEFLSLLSNKYFSETSNNRNYYNAKKVLKLIFLTTIHVKITNSTIAYADKTAFIFSTINYDEEVEGSTNIEKTNAKLETFLKELIYISTVFEIGIIKNNSNILDVYCKCSSEQKSGLFTQLEKMQDPIFHFILDKLFTNHKGEEVPFLTFSDLNNKFFQDRM